MPYLFRETLGYCGRLARFNTALESYFTEVVEDDNLDNLEELMLSSYALARHTRDKSDIKSWNKKEYITNVGYAIGDAADAISNKNGRYSLAYEVQKLECMSRSIFEYIKNKRGIGNIKNKRTM